MGDDVAEVADTILLADNAADWLLFMAARGPKPVGQLTLRANYMLCVRHNIVADAPNLTAFGKQVAEHLSKATLKTRQDEP